MTEKQWENEKKVWNKIDEISNGLYVVPSKNNIKMMELRKYCKENNLTYSSLTEKDIEKFRVHN